MIVKFRAIAFIFLKQLTEQPNTTVHHGNYRLVLNGRLEENTNSLTPVFISNLSVDPGETTNLAEKKPALTRELQICRVEFEELLSNFTKQNDVSPSGFRKNRSSCN